MMISSQLAVSQIVEVGGLIDSDTYWSSDTTYIVNDNLKVFNNALLEIEPGTLVKINQGRNITIESGSLKAVGTAQDSISFVPNYFGQESWYWNGLIISSVNQENDVSIAFVHIRRAVQAIKVIASSTISIRNSLIFDNRNLGINLTNSSFCQILDNNINSNFVGIEIYAADPGNRSASNLIKNNNLRNLTTNILIQNNNHGACPNNMIESNLIQQGSNGIWLSNNNNNGGSGNAIIRENIIYRNGNANDGYGIYVSMDSTNLISNLFIENTTAAAFTEATKCHFLSNNIYANKRGFVARNGSSLITLLDNTFTANLEEVVLIEQVDNFEMGFNNLLNNELEVAFILNKSSLDINIPQNYWATTSASLIDQFIFDGNDEPGYGQLNYLPVLENINIEAPVSAPVQVISQVVENYIKVSWDENPETDLAGYRVYYGTFTNYSFSDSSAFTTDTVVHLPLEALNGPIAVVAFDQQAQGISDQRLGNASPFAFSQQLPYAGADSSYCVNIQSVLLQNATLPFEVDSLRWSTKGDGFFENNNQLSTAYFPGQQDRLLKELTLTLSAFVGTTSLHDSLKITLVALPQVFAGSDTLLTKTANYQTSTASVSADISIWWATDGDGTFEDPTAIETTYFPGVQDQSNGQITLFLQAFTAYCGTVTDSMKIQLKNAYQVSGTLSDQNNPLPNHPVLAIPLNDNSLNRQLRFSDSAGKFSFNQLFEGTYVFYTVPNPLAAKLKASYHGQADGWQHAFQHQLLGDIYELDIRLQNPSFNLPEGNGKISGTIRFPENLAEKFNCYCQDWFDSDAADNFCQQGGLSNVSLLLYSLSREKVYDFTLSDTKGQFAFDHLPFGTYILQAEIAPYQNTQTTEITLSPTNPVLENLNISLLADQKIGIVLPENNAINQTLVVYPNPVKENLQIDLGYKPDYNHLSLNVIDVQGRAVLTKYIPAIKHFTLPVEALPAGIYLLQIKTKEGLFSHRFIKD